MKNVEERGEKMKKVEGEGKMSGKENINNVSRKNFVVTLPNAPEKEMAVFTHAKKLSEYIFVVTEKSPKKFRWNMISRLQNASIEAIEHLYRANYEKDDMRLEYQKRAMICFNLIDFYAETAKRMQAITAHQMAVIAQQLAENKKLLSGWVKSTKRKN